MGSGPCSFLDQAGVLAAVRNGGLSSASQFWRKCCCNQPFTFAGSSVGRDEAHQGDVIHKTLKHCGPWKDPPPRGPPRKPRRSQPVRPKHEADGGITYEADPDFLEHARREACRQGELPWDD